MADDDVTGMEDDIGSARHHLSTDAFFIILIFSFFHIYLLTRILIICSCGRCVGLSLLCMRREMYLGKRHHSRSMKSTSSAPRDSSTSRTRRPPSRSRDPSSGSRRLSATPNPRHPTAVLPTGRSETRQEEEKKSNDEGTEHVSCFFFDQTSAARTPAISRNAGKVDAEVGSRNKTAKKIASLIRKPVCPKAKDPTSFNSEDCVVQIISCRCPGGDIAQENQAVKRQKLDGGLSRQIHNVKSRALVHKSRPDLPADGGDLLSSRDLHGVNRKEDMQAVIQRRPKLTLTRPKEPELETAHRVRAVRIKSSAELEEEMLSKMPKFKARPINKKILEAPSLPAPQRSTPQPPEFQEFNLKTMERAARNAGASSVVSSSLSMESSTSFNDHFKINRLTEPKPPQLETSLRARPPRVKSSQELELEELERIPKFKARPLNKKIFEMRGDRGSLRRPKRQITIPQEFHFATDERMGPPAFVLEAFDKLSLHSERQTEQQRQVPRLTIPNPFHLHTEERGLEKERDLSLQILHKEIEQERARVPKANPYPYTTDYPVIPPKPAPKECTKPEAFQLESLVRHEEVMQKKMEELEKTEREEAEKRVFRAQPILEKDPFPVAKKERKPLTEVQGFALHVDHRATERAEFDQKVKEKETMYKRMRDEYEVSKKIEEEREVKQMRKTMVPTARPSPTSPTPSFPKTSKQSLLFGRSTKEITKPKSPALKVSQRLTRSSSSSSSSSFISPR
ncbi:unnamed protein product [Spirodela intermedia]|uniref:Uncharacterized protein n=1 Tax=Spirodela intermedia TaxID=51605 RepID=A0A7I8JEY6_SPIIN|nr:unnamed protein product [Spirodela intermedia]CAA6668679.1 unnamed protein product [Spirodela intermedia]